MVIFKIYNMSEQVKIFDNPEFGQVRTIEQENKVWFGATDIATALGYSNPRDAIVRHCKSAGVVNHDVGVQTGLKSDGSPSIQNITMKFINEGNVYRLIANSQLPQAEKFESWIFDDLVPKVMKEGGYIMENKEDTPEEIMARAVMIAQETIKRREQRIEMLEQEETLLTETIKEAAPKVEYFDKAMSSKSSYTTTQMAQEFGLSAKTLNARLAKMGVQYRQGEAWILYAKHQGNGYTHTISVPYMMANGEQGTQIQTRWTEKGRKFLHDLMDGK